MVAPREHGRVATPLVGRVRSLLEELDVERAAGVGPVPSEAVRRSRRDLDELEQRLVRVQELFRHMDGEGRANGSGVEESQYLSGARRLVGLDRHAVGRARREVAP